MSERMRPNLRKSWERKHKKREKKLSNCLAGLAICHQKRVVWVRVSETLRAFADLTDVTLADEDTKL